MQQNSEKSEISEMLKVNAIPFGPCAIDFNAWKRLKLIVKASDDRIGLCFALLGKIRANSFLVVDVIELAKLSTCNCPYTAEQIRNIEKEAAKQNMMLVGILHAHNSGSVPTPSEQELVLWLALMFKFERPLLFFVLSSESLKVGAYTVPPEVFAQLKDAIKLINFEGEK